MIDAALETFKRRLEAVDVHDIADRLGLQRPDRNGNYRSPHHRDRSPSLQIGGRKYPDGWYDHSAGRGGDKIGLVQYALSADFLGAIEWLRGQYAIPEDRPPQDGRGTLTLVEHIAAQSLKNPAPAADYLAGRGILPDVIERAIKLKAVGFNDWSSPKKPPGTAGHGGPATAFLVRSFNPGALVAVDLRYHEPALNGDIKTGCQGEKLGYPWTSHLKALERAHTVVVVESPINALSAESAFLAAKLRGWAAVALRGTANAHSLDLLFYRQKRIVLCLDNDAPDGKGHRPGAEASWILHARLTAQRIAAHLVDQAGWGCNDLNDLLRRAGPESAAKALQDFQPWAIPGLSGKVETGRKRVFLPSADFAVYEHFRVREDFTSFFFEEKDKDGYSAPKWTDLAGFRIADIARIDIASAVSALTGEVDHQPSTLFAVTVQSAFHGNRLTRSVIRDERLHRLDWWQRFGPVWRPAEFLRLVNLWGRATSLGQRQVVNFVGLCYKDGRPHVNGGADCYFSEPEKQCPYHNLDFPQGSLDDARRVVRAYSATFGQEAGLLLLVWALGAHLKCFLSFWPHLTLQARKGAGKTTLIERLGRSIACTIFSGQSLQTDFRQLTTTSCTSHPVGWEELSARRQDIIDRAVSTLQEGYKFTVTRRGSELTEFVTCAPVLLAGEDVPVQSLLGKVVRVQLREKGPLLPMKLPPFPVRQWLDFLAGLSRDRVLELHGQVAELCRQRCRASGQDPGARRMLDNYAAVLAAWRLLVEFAGLAPEEIPLESALIQEMNEHIAETSADREPWVWIVEAILNEIAAGTYPFPFRFGEHGGEAVFLLRPSHMMHHLKTKLRLIWDGLPIKSDRTLKKQLKEAGVILTERVDPVIGGQQHNHMLALSVAKLAEYGLYPEPPARER